MYAYIPLWIMLFQNGLCVFFILFIHTLNILFLGTRICIFTNANAIFKSCDFCVHFSQLSHEYYNLCLQYILFLYVQRDQYLVCLFHTFFSVIICPILILEIISNISEWQKKQHSLSISLDHSFIYCVSTQMNLDTQHRWSIFLMT